MSEDERQAAIQQQEEAFAAHIKERLDHLIRLVTYYAIEQKRARDEYFEHIVAWQKRFSDYDKNVGGDIDTYARRLGLQIADFQWDHNLMHDGDIERIYADFERRIQEFIPDGLDPVDLKMQVHFRLPLKRSDVVNLIYDTAGLQVRRKNHHWLPIKPPPIDHTKQETNNE